MRISDWSSDVCSSDLLVGAKTVAAPVDDHGALIFDEWLKLLSPRTKLVAVAQVSNSLGTINPVADIIREAHARGIPVLVDGAQGIAHLPIDVRELDLDFYAFSSHNRSAPTGFGVPY